MSFRQARPAEPALRRPLHTMTFGQLAHVVRALGDRAVDLARPDRPRVVPGRRTRVIGIDGMSGSGKSGFARRLAAELGASVLGVDDLVPGWDALAESVSLLTEWVLRPLAAPALSDLIWVDTPAAERRRRLELRPDWGTCQPFFARWSRQENALQTDADTRGRAGLVVARLRPP
jgi:hypothetical protein